MKHVDISRDLKWFIHYIRYETDVLSEFYVKRHLNQFNGC